MSDRPPDDMSGLADWKQWKPEAQQRALELLRQREATPWRPFYCPISACNGHPHVTPVEDRGCAAYNGHEWGRDTGWNCRICGVAGNPVDDWLFEHARADQKPPKWSDDWLVWALAGGRGSGKTRTGSEVTHRVTNLTPRIILIAPTGPDLRETMVEGVSGLVATAPPDKQPQWEPSKKKLTWPNGCIAQGFSAEEPDRLRGPQSGFVWADEPAHYPDANAVWDNMLFGLRIGKNPKVVATTTPKPTKWMKALLKAEDTVVHRVATYANLANLSGTFSKTVIERYKGTRTGRQELYGELLEDVEGALWSWDMFEYIEEAPHLDRIVVSVDPAGSANRRSDETGIGVIGIAGKTLYVLADLSGKFSPAGWADVAVTAHDDFSADAIIAEKNYGGDMVKHTLENAAERSRKIAPRIILVDSRRGKAIRAEPIVALYEKKKVKHVGQQGDLNKLEDEQTSWVPGEGDSPNRVDMLVHGATHLAKNVMPAEIASPNSLRHLRAV